MPSGVKMTLEYFIEKSKEIHSNKYSYDLIEKYEGCRKKLPIKCSEHGVFWQRPCSHLQGQGCPKCADAANSKRLTNSTEEFISKAVQIHGNKYDYSSADVLNRREDGKIPIICHELDEFGDEHGVFWMEPKMHIAGQGCPRCGGTYHYTTEEWIELAKKRHPFENYDYSKTQYINNTTPVCVICPEHGEVWRHPKHFLYRAIGCPHCAHRSMLEDKVKKMLEKNNIRYQREVTSRTLSWLKGLRLDFYLSDYNIAIECQGEQHFRPIDFAGKGQEWAEDNFSKTLVRDDRKRNLCIEHGIKLLYFAETNVENYTDIISDINVLLETIKS